MTIERFFARTAVLVAVFATTIGAQQKEKPIPATPQSSPSAPASGAASTGKSVTADPNYVIGAQDVLDINVWKEDQLTKTVPVRPDGKISLPLLNDVKAAGLTPTQLSNQITESLKKIRDRSAGDGDRAGNQ